MEENTTTAPQKNNTAMIMGIVALLLVGGGLLYVASNRNNTATVQPTPVAQQETEEKKMAPTGVEGETSETAMGEVKEFTVDGSNFKFAPSDIKVKQGDKVKITFTNSAGFHDFVIDELGVKTPVIQSGQDAVVEFVADKAGTFTYYCSVGNHRQQGMEGTLIVE
jgi:plastocyanin